MNYLTKEEYEKALLLLPEPNKSDFDTFSVSTSIASASTTQSDTAVHFIKVLYCDSARIPEKQYKWLLDKRYNQME